MDALEIIKSRLTVDQVKDLLVELGFEHVSARGNNIRACCKIHGGDNPSSFVYTLTNHMWFCHVCKEGGDVVHIVQCVKNYNFETATKFLLGFIGITDLEGIVLKERASQHMKELKAFMKYCNTRIVQLSHYELGVPTKQVKGFRHFDEQLLKHFGMCYVESMPFTRTDASVGTLRNRLGVPILFKQDTVGYAFRRINEAEMPKWLFQPSGLDKKNLLYNYTDEWYDEIIICEGMFDVWAWHNVGRYAVAVLGSSISDEQINLLTRTTTTLILSFDGDDAGHLATQKAIEQLKYKFDIRVVPFDKGNDPCDYNKEELEKLYEEKIHYAKWRKL